MYDGYIVCEEFADLVMDAWNQEQEVKVLNALPTRIIEPGYLAAAKALHVGPAPALM